MSLLGGDGANPATEAPATALTLTQAAERIASKSAPQPEPRERPTAQAEDDDQAEVQTDGGEPDEGEAPADGEGEDGEEDADSGEDEDDAQERPPLDLTQKVKVKIDGEEREVSLSEALAGYQRLSNYTRGKQELAREREAFATEQRTAAEAQTAIAQERQQLAAFTQLIETQLLAGLPTPEYLAQLQRTNPQQYLMAKDAAQQRVAAVQGLRGQAQALLAKGEQEAQQARAKAVTTAHEALARDIPEWTDAAKRQAIQAEMAGTLRGAGYTDPEIAQIVDPRIIRFVHQAQRDAKDAAAYRALQARNPRTEQRVADAPRVAKPGAAVSGKAVAAGQLRDLQKRADKTGRIEDVAAVIAARSARK